MPLKVGKTWSSYHVDRTSSMDPTDLQEMTGFLLWRAQLESPKRWTMP